MFFLDNNICIHIFLHVQLNRNADLLHIFWSLYHAVKTFAHHFYSETQFFTMNFPSSVSLGIKC
jgi:hypothetical protein